MDISKAVTRYAVELAKEIEADAILVLTETLESFDAIIKEKPGIPIIGATADDDTFQLIVKKATVSTLNVDFIETGVKKTGERLYGLKLLMRELSSASQIEDAVIIALNKGIINDGDTILAVGSSLDTEIDSIFVYPVKMEKLDLKLHQFIREIDVKPDVFESVLNIALEIGREGREGRLIGTAFLIGDVRAVFKKSKSLILNPFKGHGPGERIVTDPASHETIKELAQLDGAFIIAEDGVTEAAGIYLNVNTAVVDIPRGLGARHAAVAAMTTVTNTIGVTVSESGGIVRVFKEGKVVLTIEPQRKIALRPEVKRG